MRSVLDFPGFGVSLAAAVRASFAAILLLIVLPVAQAAETTPTNMLNGIYRDAVKGKTSGWLTSERREKYLSKALLALWAKCDAKKAPEGYAGPVDFDLTTDTNALELGGFEIKVRSVSTTQAVLAVKLDYRKPYYRPGPPAVITYDFIRENGRWRIDSFGTKGWSVRDILTEWLKET